MEEDWPLADLLALFAVVLFLLLGGHRIYILALARSFETIPLAAMPSVESFGMFARLCMVLGGELFLLAFVLAAPVLASVFLADMTIGWISRPPAGASLGAMLQPMRALLGVGAVLVTVAVLAETIPGVLEAALGQVDRAVNIFGSGVGR